MSTTSTTAPAEKKKDNVLDLLEEDDEFEEFVADGKCPLLFLAAPHLKNKHTKQSTLRTFFNIRGFCLFGQIGPRKTRIRRISNCGVIIGER
jgi:hypothetical protein